MTHRDPLEAVPSALRDALRRRGFTSLTPVQTAVLSSAHEGRDLRISSQTGSGKTVAIGFVVRSLLDREPAPEGKAMPRALVIEPTRELAAQVKAELSWLFEDNAKKIVAVTGGTSTREERRELSHGADIVVGTPGRLLDHLEKGALDASEVGAVVLDEADQMLDLGFREALLSILGKLPAARQTHLVSATFSREVLSLAQRYQKNAVGIEGTRLGEANTSISHVMHVVRNDQRVDALVNLLLAAPEEQTLIFVRTRADTGELTRKLVEAGFHASALSGDMDQEDRTRTLNAFRNGRLHVLVATDVAARGIDVPDIGRVIHADPPNDADTYTHRSGRTGRAGRTGVSMVLVPPVMRARIQALLRRAKVEPTVLPIPDAAEISRLADERLAEALTVDSEASQSPRLREIAKTLLARTPAEELIPRLLAKLQHTGPAEPRKIAAPPPLQSYPPPAYPDAARGQRDSQYRSVPHPRSPQGLALRAAASQGAAQRREAPASAPQRREAPSSAPHRRDASPPPARTETHAAPPRREAGAAPAAASRPVQRRPWDEARGTADATPFVAFRVNWGEKQGADARRLLALVCRRGDIRGSDVGAIQIGATSSTFEVAGNVAATFTEAAKRPDSRDARVKIEVFDPKKGGPVHDAMAKAPKRHSPYTKTKTR